MARVVVDSNLALRQIEDGQEAQKQKAMEIMDEVMHDIEQAFLTYGLAEEQETRLLDIVQRGVDKSLENFEQGLKLDEQLRAIVTRLALFSSL